MHSKRGFLYTLLFVSLLFSADRVWCQEKETASPLQAVPEEYRSNVEEALKLAGENASEVEKFLSSAPENQRKGAAFLVANLPSVYLVSADCETLLEHLTYSYKTKEIFDWAKEIPEEIFFSYVLAPIVTQEPLEKWRKYLFERIYPRVKGMKTAEGIALEINRWCAQRAGYKPTQARDQGVFETLKRGVGRCEELMILYIYAARSVGLPAREVSTPFWSTCDSNHAWVEVWCSGKWHYLGACEPANSLDKGWFSQSVTRAPLVTSCTFGTPESENIYRKEKRWCVINSTGNYSTTCDLEIAVLDGNKNVVAKGPVYFCVFNSGALLPFAKRETDENGKASISLGIGDFFVSAGKEKEFAWKIVTTKAGEKISETLTIAEKTNYPDGLYWLRYPPLKKPKEITQEAEKPPQQQEMPPEDMHKAQQFDPEKNQELMTLISSSSISSKVVDALKRSGGNHRNIANAIFMVEKDRMEDLLYLLAESPDLDLIEATPEVLLEHVMAANFARQVAEYLVPDDLYRSHVLSPRIGYEPLRAWRTQLFKKFHRIMGQTASETAKAVNLWIKQNITVSGREALGGAKTTLDVVRSRCGREGEICAAAVGILRSLAIPARFSKSQQWVEFYTGSEWLPFYPLQPEDFGNTKKSETTKTEYETPGTLSLAFQGKGVPLPEFEGFAVAQLSDGLWNPQWSEKGTDGDGKAQLELSPGKYLFSTGVRNKNGDAYIFLKPVQIQSKETVELTVKLDIPMQQLSREDLVVRELEKIPDFTLSTADGKEQTLGKELQTGNAILVFFTLDNEPCKSMLPRIERALTEKGQRNTRLIYVFVGKPDSAVVSAFIAENKIAHPILLDEDCAVAKKFNLPQDEGGKFISLPSIILITKDGKVAYWEEGFNLAIDSALQFVLEMIEK
jgi:transglutaminase-like putative cysteine protease/peroxiredoxin